MPSFNLIDRPWIPCVPRRGGGEPLALGLRDALVWAHEQRELRDSSPLVTVALHRLLLTVVHRVIRGPRTVGEWQALWTRGQFDVERVSSYLESCRSRFDLFDAARPFYQVPRMEGVNAVGAAKLAHEKASGNNITLFDHTTPTMGGLTPAQAARYLVAFQAFAVGGGVSQPFNLSDAPLARDYTVLVRGDTLFETLLLNLVRYTEQVPIRWRDGDDPPAWEREGAREPRKEGTSPEGYLDYLTWQSRRVHLVYDAGAGLVCECQIRQNLKLDPTGVFDPSKPYRMSKEAGWFSARLSEERAVWRDSHALLEVAEDATKAASKRPGIFEWLADIQLEDIEAGDPCLHEHEHEFDVLGYLNDGAQATIILWRHDRLPLPLRYLSDRGLRDRLRDGLQLAEEVSGVFRPTYAGSGGRGQKGQRQAMAGRRPGPMLVLAEELLRGTSERRADPAEIKNLVKHFNPERDVWAALEPHFRAFMVRLAERADAGGEEGTREALGEWVRDVGMCARNSFRAVISSLDTNARALRAAALAERAFNWQLHDLLATFRARYDISEEEEVMV